MICHDNSIKQDRCHAKGQEKREGRKSLIKNAAIHLESMPYTYLWAASSGEILDLCCQLDYIECAIIVLHLLTLNVQYLYF
jgi:hypothetical protein